MVNASVIGSLLTFGIFVASITYHTGKLAARVETLEKWRESIRFDMHEISQKLETISNELKELKTLINERTERRVPRFE